MARRLPTLGEEIANAISHGAGAVTSLAVLPFLVLVAVWHSDPIQVAANAVFGAMLFLLYLASTVYHAVPQSRAKAVCQRLDHAAIYLLIAGTYTPFALGPLRGPAGYLLLAAVWTLALFGVLSKLILGAWKDRLSTVLYLLMGWLCVLMLPAIWREIPPQGLLLLFMGGVIYSAGTIFYSWDRLRYGHLIWHLFVIGGSACHVAAVLLVGGV
ncbi:MAG: hemolysin III family protein [Anaerolineae bacterium]